MQDTQTKGPDHVSEAPLIKQELEVQGSFPIPGIPDIDLDLEVQDPDHNQEVPDTDLHSEVPDTDLNLEVLGPDHNLEAQDLTQDQKALFSEIEIWVLNLGAQQGFLEALH